MRVKPVSLPILLFFSVIFIALTTQADSPPSSYAQSAQLIRDSYERKLFTLSPSAESHFGLRMYRQTQDKKYLPAIWSDMAQVASQLNRFANEVVKPEDIILYSSQRLAHYQSKDSERSQLRYTVSKHHPEYLYLGVELLSAMARADEYGLKHINDDVLREIIRRYDFTHYVTDKEMIEAWAAQLANQVYWLRQLGEQDLVDDFTSAFKTTYPDDNDKRLSTKQYWNKIYGLTHIIFADSQYYQRQVSEEEHQWIYDYLRQNIDNILRRCKEDVIAEVGIAFLLAGLNHDPVVEKTRHAIRAAIDSEQGMIPSTDRKFDLNSGEHRNILAIMLLDWRGVNKGPDYQTLEKSFQSIPYGLVPKKPES
ncbi:DUF3541 domain-containing protein [Vibrio sp. B1FLJ16]|uniref:DUF3541 domain-containing protein n=1 Tax=Vibrio sp. B1FLJ16 TaxID=2751178 RepID=UPI0015F52D97|nr:DUF3541 domain-containing protein [Vibrio sp. B1FLJ16]CAD7823894.1 hypothetical protein ACOMICROBIO_EPCKBFOG_04468 [Vibrio sp. B1FLJ16]CAE6953092.1 hypothetical protein ACOMICROBIO_EPCKBFOG_04468 [Vibrio sp. B1FLJ16]